MNFECEGRFRIQKCERPKRMDVEQGNFLKALLKPRQTRHTYLFATSVETTQKMHISENRPIQHGEECISNKLVPRFELRFRFI